MQYRRLPAASPAAGAPPFIIPFPCTKSKKASVEVLLSFCRSSAIDFRVGPTKQGPGTQGSDLIWFASVPKSLLKKARRSRAPVSTTPPGHVLTRELDTN